MCSFIDPQFKFKYVRNEEAVKKTVYDDGIAKFEGVTTSDPVHLQWSSEVCEPPAKRKRTLGSLFKENDTECSDSPTTISPQRRVESEVDMCINEARLDAEEDPLRWWRLHGEPCPMLLGVAKNIFAY